MLRQLATAHPELYGSLFHQTFQRYPTPTFALCGHIGLSLAEVLDADVGFGFARYDNPYPNLFFFHGQATIAKVIDAEVNAEFTTEGYVHFDAAVKGGYPNGEPVGQLGHRAGLRVLQEAVQRRGARGDRDPAAGLHDRRQRPRVQQGPRRLPVLQDVPRHVAAGRRRGSGAPAARGAGTALLAFGLAGLGYLALLPLTVSFAQEQLPAMAAAVSGGVIAFYQIGYGIAAFGSGPLQDAGVSLPATLRRHGRRRPGAGRAGGRPGGTRAGTGSRSRLTSRRGR